MSSKDNPVFYILTVGVYTECITDPKSYLFTSREKLEKFAKKYIIHIFIDFLQEFKYDIDKSVYIGIGSTYTKYINQLFKKVNDKCTFVGDIETVDTKLLHNCMFDNSLVNCDHHILYFYEVNVGDIDLESYKSISYYDYLI